MEKTIITMGKTIDAAIESALNQLGLDRDSVSVQVLAQAKSGFLGIGATPAKVEVTYEVPDPQPKVALSSASRSKPKSKPVVKPETPKAEAPK
ncbi:MAG: Jag N-terminal domain-containing protein, partial [Oscillospiraceae bacterium]|nr:Jag N-terminal domain-containing protein [Oscillospiraceae bacterium]